MAYSKQKTWYDATVQKPFQNYDQLDYDITLDICVLGAGFTGIEAAHLLSQSPKGYHIAVIDAAYSGAGAAGRNGGHLDRGLARDALWIKNHYGDEMAKIFCHASTEARDQVVANIRNYQIDCDLRFGHVTAALKPSHLSELQMEEELWQSWGLAESTMLDRDQLTAYIQSPCYIGGSYNPKSGHLHPLKYLKAMNDEITARGVKIFENTKAINIESQQDHVVIKTEKATMKAKKLIIAGDALLGALVPKLKPRLMTATAHVIATEKIDHAQLNQIYPQNVAVYDANFIMNYFRPTADKRLIFGGSVSYGDMNAQAFYERELLLKLKKIFPTLADLKADYFWSGKLGLTMNRMPDLGQLSPHVYYCQGLSGHGINTSHMAAKILTSALESEQKILDLCETITHYPFPGGAFFRRPAFMLAMLYYKLRDRFS